MIFVPAIALANCLKTTTRRTRILRTIFFIPVAISFVSASYLWKWIYNDTAGLLNYLLNLAGFIRGQQSWLSETWMARTMVSVMIAWKTQGMTMIILIAGLQSIPQALYEAAEMDGASKRQRFRFITLPMLRPVVVLSLIISIAGSFKAFDHFFIMTRGGPMKTTQTIVMYINKLAFEYFDIGFGSAVSVVLLVILFIVSALQMKLGGYKND
jgi:multiple sugar transport system permease protein